MLHGAGSEIGIALVKHPLTRAAGFTGSRVAGRALFNASASRPDPIPIFAEMSSLNPLFILPGALRERGAQIAEGLKNSVTLGVGQFCTKPGLVFGLGGADYESFAETFAEAIRNARPATMLHPGIQQNRASRGTRQPAQVCPVAVLSLASERCRAAARTDARRTYRLRHRRRKFPASSGIARGSLRPLHPARRCPHVHRPAPRRTPSRRSAYRDRSTTTVEDLANATDLLAILGGAKRGVSSSTASRPAWKYHPR